MTKHWERPELIVLIRRKSDEVILQGCRESSGGPTISNAGCLGDVSENCTPHCF
jgi:hypothetical protein